MQIDKWGNTCVVGLQWGDEGKGKVIDEVVGRFDAVVRYSGGPNAGHTVVVGGEKFALHQIPSGVLHGHVLCLITCGSVIDPAVLLGEIEMLRSRGVEVHGKLRISDRAHVIFPYHRKQDVLSEAAAGASKLGTTARGIGPCYSDKVARRAGIRLGELYDPAHLRRRLEKVVAYKNAALAALFDLREPFDSEALAAEYLEFAEQLRPFVTDTVVELHDLLARGKRLLFEGAQGSLLDVDHGTYPFVTSCNSGVGGVSSGAGIPPTALRTILGVVKAYTTRVGEGPLPTELDDSLGHQIRERGGEYGTTTGRPRRVGWFDAVAARYAAMFTGPTRLAIMHMDTLSGLESLNLCVSYQHNGRILNTIPANAYTLAEATPIYESLPGWKEDLGHCRTWQDLPAAARAYAQRIAVLLDTRVGLVGVGPAREQMIHLDSEG